MLDRSNNYYSKLILLIFNPKFSYLFMKSEMIAINIFMPLSEELCKQLNEDRFTSKSSEPSKRSHIIPTMFVFFICSRNQNEASRSSFFGRKYYCKCYYKFKCKLNKDKIIYFYGETTNTNFDGAEYCRNNGFTELRNIMEHKYTCH